MTLKTTILTTAAASVAVLGISSIQSAPAVSAEVTLRSASCFPIGSPPSRPYENVV